MRKYMLRPDRPDNRDFLFKSTWGAPLTVDLRPFDAVRIFNQELGDCTTNAICAMLSYLDKSFGSSTHEMFFHYSRLFLYWKERELMGTIDYDSGAYIRDGLKILNQIGCATEPLYPYVASDFRNPPSREAMENASLHKISEYRRLNNNEPSQLRESLANGYPVVMGFEVYESFEGADVERTGVVPMPNKLTEQFLGGHAVLAMGYTYRDGKEYIICRNSWGADWGDKGYFYMPMDFVGRYIHDMWTAKP